MPKQKLRTDVDLVQAVMHKQLPTKLPKRFGQKNRGNSVIVTDFQTHRSIAVPLYAAGEVLAVLSFLFPGS